MSEITGVTTSASGPVNGAVVDCWLVSRFSGVNPVYNAAPPSGSPDGGPVTSGTAFGGLGAYTITGIPDGVYHVRASLAGNSTWAWSVETTADADIVHRTGAETIAGVKTFSSAPVVPAASFPESAIANLTTDLAAKATDASVLHTTGAESASGNKSLSGLLSLSGGLTVTAGAITLPNGSIAQAAIAGAGTPNAGVDIGSSQTITGVKTFTNDPTMLGGRLIGQQLAQLSAPVITTAGTPGSTTYQYQMVATSYDGRETIPSPTGQTTTGNATLNGTNYNIVTWSPVPGAASYRVLKFTGTWQTLAAGLSGSTYNDNGSASPSPYAASTANPGGEASLTDLTIAGGAAPRGTLSYVPISSNQTGINANVALTGLTATVTVGANRRLKITGMLPLVNSTVDGDTGELSVYQNGVAIGAARGRIQLSGGELIVIVVWYVTTAGSYTYNLALGRSSGSGTFSTNGGATFIGSGVGVTNYILVEDIGS